MYVSPAGITIVPPLPHVDKAILMAGTSSIELFPADEGVQVPCFTSREAWPNAVAEANKAKQSSFFYLRNHPIVKNETTASCPYLLCITRDTSTTQNRRYQ